MAAVNCHLRDKLSIRALLTISVLYIRIKDIDLRQKGLFGATVDAEIGGIDEVSALSNALHLQGASRFPLLLSVIIWTRANALPGFGRVVKKKHFAVCVTIIL